MSADDLSLAHAIVETLEEKKGEDITLLDLLGVASFTDYFVICTCSSERSSGWILVDYGGVILHLMSPATRDYYRLEELWQAGKVLLRVQ
jgi:ribosome-associated protein